MLERSTATNPELDEAGDAIVGSIGSAETDYVSALQNCPVPICIYALDAFQILEVNHAALRRYGYGRSELVGADVRRLLHPDEVGRFHASTCRAHPGPHKGDVWRHRTKSGRELLVRVSTHVMRFQGHVAQLALAHDVFEHKIVAHRARKAERKLRAALTQTIQVLASAAEQRDAYTAGHQQRVAELATAIGAELQLPTDQIEGLRLGALVHDIGKLGIPAELLSLPRLLRKEELALVRMHPQIGYEILSDVEYPWPIREMILQHHERLDGSGYPNQLRGAELCLEVRILSVADVVEAMASHRPYRPGAGIDRAIAEVYAGRGMQFDADVVDACQRLYIRGELASFRVPPPHCWP